MTSAILENVPLTTSNTEELEGSIQKAIQKLNVHKESDLCSYIPFLNGRLHHFAFRKMKKKDPETLTDLIQTNILTQENPQKLPPTPRKRGKKLPTLAQPTLSIPKDSLDDLIAQALQRKDLKIRQEKDLCKYLPSEKGGRLHYSTFQSMKQKKANELKELIQKHLFDPKTPNMLSPLPRLSRHAKEERSLQANLNETTIAQLAETMKELIQILKTEVSLTKSLVSIPQGASKDPLLAQLSHTPKQEDLVSRLLRTIQNQLIKQIRKKEVDCELWDAYVELVQGE